MITEKFGIFQSNGQNDTCFRLSITFLPFLAAMSSSRSDDFTKLVRLLVRSVLGVLSSLDPDFLNPKAFLTQNLWDQNFSNPTFFSQILHTDHFLNTYFSTKQFLDPKPFLNPNLFKLFELSRFYRLWVDIVITFFGVKGHYWVGMVGDTLQHRC